MADKAIKKGKKGTSRYLPEAAWAAMSKAERLEKILKVIQNADKKKDG